MSYRLNYVILGEDFVMPFEMAGDETVYRILNGIAKETEGRINPLACQFWLVGNTYCTGPN